MALLVVSRVWCLSCALFVHAEGLLECTIEAVNIGNVGLANFSLSGDVTNCSQSAPARSVAPGRSVICSLRKTVTEQEVAAAGSLALTYPLTVAPLGTVSSLRSFPLQTYAASLSKLIASSPACGACRSCLVSTRDFVQQFGTQADVPTLARSFATFCEQSASLRLSQACSRVQSMITNSTMGNLGRRAAGLCLELQLCDRKLGTSCSSQVTVGTSNVTVSAATLDVCTGKFKNTALRDRSTWLYCVKAHQAVHFLSIDG